MVDSEKTIEKGNAVATDTVAEPGNVTEGQAASEGQTETPTKVPTEMPTHVKGPSAAYQIPKSQVDMASMKKINVPDVRSRIQTEFESNLGYHQAADKIITVSQKYLENQQRNKTELRKKLAKLFSALLIVEYAFMVIFILADAIVAIPVEIPAPILQIYITSVFVQTLMAMSVMIAFAFISKEETRIVELLSQIIQNYQKFQIGSHPKQSSDVSRVESDESGS